MMLIFLNAIYMFFQINISLINAKEHKPDPDWMWWVDAAFAVAFVLELLVRIAIFKKEFFFGRLWRWNAFDTLLVLTPVFDVVFSLLNLAFLRSLKALRLLRYARLIRSFSWVRELRLMVASIICS